MSYFIGVMGRKRDEIFVHGIKLESVEIPHTNERYGDHGGASESQ